MTKFFLKQYYWAKRVDIQALTQAFLGRADTRPILLFLSGLTNTSIQRPWNFQVPTVIFFPSQVTPHCAKASSWALMAARSSENESAVNRSLLSLYSNYLWNRLQGLYTSSSTNFIGSLYNLRNVTARFRSGKRRECLPLPLPSNTFDSSLYGHFPFLFSFVWPLTKSMRTNSWSFMFQAHLVGS